MKYCQCGGVNENCHWCFGTGTIKEPSSTSIPAKRPKASHGPSRLPVLRLNEIRCLYCDEFVKESEYASHLKKQHRIILKKRKSRKRKKEEPTGKLNVNLKATNESEKCLYCDLILLKSMVDKHVKRAHGSGHVHEEQPRALPNNNSAMRASISKHKPESASGIKLRSDLVQCLQCGCKVRGDRLQKHLSRVHRASKIELNSQEIEKRKESIGISELRLDITRDYAHNYRDRGKFGSHPSHDDFSDESDP